MRPCLLFRISYNNKKETGTSQKGQRSILMSQWNSTVHFRDLIKDYNSNAPDELAEIKRIKPKWIERFNTISQLKHFIPSLKKIKTESGFNKWLTSVYNYCDLNRIWIEI